MSKTNDVEGFLEWLGSHQLPPPPKLSAGDALARLQSTEFSDLASVMALSDAIHDCAPIPLVQDKQRQYVVVPRSPALTTLGDMTSDPKPVPVGTKLTIHPEFDMLVQAKLAPPPPKSRPTLPKFVYPLGVVLQRDIRPVSELTLTERATLVDEADDPPFKETNYAVVVDVISADHPVWLVYDRNPYDEMAGEPVAANPAKMPTVFPVVGAANFDAAQAVAKLKAWSVNPPLPTLADFKKLVNVTKTQGAVTASTVWMDDLAKARNRYSSSGSLRLPP
jgi:hypothetical protein